MGAANDIRELLRNYWPVLLGNTLEWYEFAVYGCWTSNIVREVEETGGQRDKDV